MVEALRAAASGDRAGFEDQGFNAILSHADLPRDPVLAAGLFSPEIAGWLLLPACLIAIAGLVLSWYLRRSALLLKTQADELLDSQARLREREKWFAGLFDSAPDPMVVLDGTGRFIYLNRAALKITRYAKHELLGRRFAESGLLTAPSLSTALSAFAEVLQGQVIPLIELDVIRRDKTHVILEANPRLLSERDHIQGVLVTLRDISHRKITEERLRKSEASLVLAQRIGHVGSWELNPDNDRLEWSAETYRIFGCDALDFTPTREGFYRLVHPGDRELVRREAEAAIAAGGTYDTEHRILRPDGTERVVHERAEVIKDAAGRIAQCAGTVQDITEHKKLEERLRHSQKMEAIGQLAGGIAHDFNNIMSIIQGYTQILLERREIEGDASEQLRQVALAAERAAHLTRQLLAFSRKQVMQFQPLDFNEIISNVGQMLQRVLGEDVALQLHLAPHLPHVRADASMLELVLLNFAVNARDAMPRGGCLRVRTESVQLNDSDARRHPEARSGQFVRLTITDTGRGMDARTLSRIFEPFFSTKEFGASSGLGLATVYGVVQQHQGWIQAASQPGKGTTFQVFLPVETAASPAPGPSRSGTDTAGSTASGGEETILLVEDEPSLRELVKVILKAQGYQVIEAGSGPEALQVYEKHQGKINLLLTDMVMPGGLSGTDVAVQLQSLTPELKVLYTSGYSLDLVRGDFSLKPGLNFIPKPYTATALTKAVRDSLDR